MSTHQAAVLGQPIDHSLSPVLHRAGYEAAGLSSWQYHRHEVSEADFPDFLETVGPRYDGFSVTMPLKFAALRHAHAASDRARLIGAANTLLRTEHGWWADNTDTEGVAGALEELLTGEISTAVIIGSGGTARPALWALAQRSVRQVVVLNRSDRRDEILPLAQALGVELDYRLIAECAKTGELSALTQRADVVISTVPAAGLAGYELQLAHAPILDVIYEPWPTELAIAAAANGHRCVGGHSMLAHQAMSQFELFTGQPAPREQMRAALANHIAAQ